MFTSIARWVGGKVKYILESILASCKEEWYHDITIFFNHNELERQTRRSRFHPLQPQQSIILFWSIVTQKRTKISTMFLGNAISFVITAVLKTRLVWVVLNGRTPIFAQIGSCRGKIGRIHRYTGSKHPDCSGSGYFYPLPLFTQRRTSATNQEIALCVLFCSSEKGPLLSRGVKVKETRSNTNASFLRWAITTSRELPQRPSILCSFGVLYGHTPMTRYQALFIKETRGIALPSAGAAIGRKQRDFPKVDIWEAGVAQWGQKSN